jgi:hypothetical protein
MNAIVPVKASQLQRAAVGLPEVLVRAGPNAIFAAEEFFKATINNNHTKRAYGRAVKCFLAWCEHEGIELRDVTPGLAGKDVQYLAGHSNPRTTQIYDRRRRHVTRNIVEPISI